MAIRVTIDVMLAERQMSVGELAEKVGITPANISILKNNHARAIRFSTLEALCRALDCEPGDLLRRENHEATTEEARKASSMWDEDSRQGSPADERENPSTTSAQN